MLILRPNCECCDRDLPADQNGALICSYECTFCENCMREMFDNTCPNCQGNVSPRPLRQGDNLAQNPASTQRVLSRYELIPQEGPKTFKRTRLLPVPDNR